MCCQRERAAADGVGRPLAAIAEHEEAQSEVLKGQAPAKKGAKSGKTGAMQPLMPAAGKEPQTSPTRAQTAAGAAQGDTNGTVKSGAIKNGEATAKAGAEDPNPT